MERILSLAVKDQRFVQDAVGCQCEIQFIDEYIVEFTYLLFLLIYLIFFSHVLVGFIVGRILGRQFEPSPLLVFLVCHLKEQIENNITLI